MTSTLLKIVAFTLTASAGSFCFAQLDVDQADSLNFEAFHKDKKESIKVWKDDKTKKEETVKAYDQSNTTAPATTPNTGSSLSSAPVTSAAPAAAAAPAAKSGQRYEVRERYTLSRSTKTPYSAFYVIEALHQQSAKLCPKGWKKLNERSEPVEQDFFQYFEIECL